MTTESPVKVVHLITLLEFGGAQGNTLYTVNHLDKKRFDTYLWAGQGAYWDAQAQAETPDAHHLTFLSRLVRPINPLWDWVIVLELALRLKKIKPQILHTHSSKAGIVGRLAGALAGVPVVIHTYHGFGFHDHQNLLIRWFYIALEKFCAKFTDAFIFVSESNLKTAQSLKLGDASKYTLIRSGVPIETIRQESIKGQNGLLRKSLGIPDSARLITTIGPFKPQKNLSDFIQMAQLVSAQAPDAHFLIIGDGEQRPILEELRSKLNLRQRLHMPGWRQDAAQWLGTSDIFAMTSLWEGLPRSLVEAMSLGIPSVCYDTDGVRDLLPRGGGVLLPQGDFKGVAKAILQILHDNRRWAELSAQSKKLITREFDIDLMVKQQEDLYTKLLSVTR